MSILLDTGVLHGFLNTKDQRHQDAMTIIEAVLDGKHGTAVTTTFVVDEAITLANVRGQPFAVVGDLLGMIGMNPGAGLPSFITLTDVTHTDIAAATRLQERHWARGLSFTDCTSLQIMTRDNIDAIATFDGGFDGLVPVIAG
jgi:predicted nucleic acid-binding protein